MKTASRKNGERIEDGIASSGKCDRANLARAGAISSIARGDVGASARHDSPGVSEFVAFAASRDQPSATIGNRTIIHE
jgi:hypothetical protein